MALGPTHPPYSMYTGSYFADSKMANDSPSSGTEIKNECNYTSSPPVCLHSMNTDNFMFTFACLHNKWYKLTCDEARWFTFHLW